MNYVTLEAIRATVNDDEPWDTPQHLKRYTSPSRAAQWAKYRALGMPSPEGTEQDQDSIAFWRPRVAAWYGYYGPWMEANSWFDARLIIATPPFYPEFGQLHYLDVNGDIHFISNEDGWRIITCMGLYCKRSMERFETSMKINQFGTGGKGGLLANYPH